MHCSHPEAAVTKHVCNLVKEVVYELPGCELAKTEEFNPKMIGSEKSSKAPENIILQNELQLLLN